MANPITVVSDDEAARVLANGHPKSMPPTFENPRPIYPGSPGSGAAPGANGPPTTGAIGPGGPLGTT